MLHTSGDSCMRSIPSSLLRLLLVHVLSSTTPAMMNRNLVTYERGSMRESRYLDCDDCMEGLQIMRGEEDKRVNFGGERGWVGPALPACNRNEWNCFKQCFSPFCLSLISLFLISSVPFSSVLLSFVVLLWFFQAISLTLSILLLKWVHSLPLFSFAEPFSWLFDALVSSFLWDLWIGVFLFETDVCVFGFVFLEEGKCWMSEVKKVEFLNLIGSKNQRRKHCYHIVSCSVFLS